MSWVAGGLDPLALPRKLKPVLDGVEKAAAGTIPEAFPYTWLGWAGLGWVQAHQAELLERFCGLFGEELQGASRADLQQFLLAPAEASGSGMVEAPFAQELISRLRDLVAEILARALEQRQRRQLATAFRQRDAVLSRVRGRIDHLTTASRQLLAKGQVACIFEELTVDRPRNRYVRAALVTVARLVSQPSLAHRCRGLAHGLRLQGMVGEPPSRQQIRKVSAFPGRPGRS